MHLNANRGQDGACYTPFDNNWGTNLGDVTLVLNLNFGLFNSMEASQFFNSQHCSCSPPPGYNQWVECCPRARSSPRQL